MVDNSQHALKLQFKGVTFQLVRSTSRGKRPEQHLCCRSGQPAGKHVNSPWGIASSLDHKVLTTKKMISAIRLSSSLPITTSPEGSQHVLIFLFFFFLTLFNSLKLPPRGPLAFTSTDYEIKRKRSRSRQSRK